MTSVLEAARKLNNDNTNLLRTGIWEDALKDDGCFAGVLDVAAFRQEFPKGAQYAGAKPLVRPRACVCVCVW